MAGPDRRDLGRVFNEVPELYDRVRPAYPDELFADLVAITGMDRQSPVLEVGCSTGQATRCSATLSSACRAIREPLLDAIAERIRTQMGDRASRRYLSVLRVGRRAG